MFDNSNYSISNSYVQIQKNINKKIRLIYLSNDKTKRLPDESVESVVRQKKKIKEKNVKNEASLLDRIKMTKMWLEFNRIKMTMMNDNDGTCPKLYNNEH